jgi:hypothetical protein
MVGISTASKAIGIALHTHTDYIKKETLAVDLKKGDISGAEAQFHSLDGEELSLSVAVV